MPVALLAALAVAAASRGVAADASQVVLSEQGQASREQAAESRRPLERAGELERRSQRRKARRDVPAQAQPPLVRSTTLLPSFDGLGVSLDDADAIVKMRQIHPAQYARSPGVVHMRELAALHEELSTGQAGGRRVGAE